LDASVILAGCATLSAARFLSAARDSLKDASLDKEIDLIDKLLANMRAGTGRPGPV